MSTDAIMSYISECSRAGRLEFQVSIQCAPVLKGIKASNLVTMAKGSLQTVRNALAGTEITAVMLAAGDRTEVLLLYRFPMLKAVLANKEIREFLKSCGYVQFDLAYFSKIRSRMSGILSVITGISFCLPVTGKYIIILLRQGRNSPGTTGREKPPCSRS